jgi:hypothetical protein
MPEVVDRRRQPRLPQEPLVRDEEPLEVFAFCPECAEREFG